MLMHHHAQMGSQAQVSALRLRDEGLTFAQIGAELGVSRQRAHQLVREGQRWLESFFGEHR